MQLIILGMHRSGTSALAGFFEHAGFYFGPPEKAFPLHDTNEKGFFERKDVVRINDRLLESADASWIAPHRFPPLLDCDFQELDLQADAKAILDEMDSRKNWFIKDPRLCITMPFWQPMLSDPYYILVLRHPMAVARSLFRRGDCPVAVGLALWEKYTRDMYRYTRGHRRAMIWFEDVMQDPSRVLGALFAGLGGNYSLMLERCDRADMDAWFDRGLVHHAPSDAELSEYASESLTSLYRSLRKDPGDASDSALAPLSKGSHQHLRTNAEQWRIRRLEMERSRAWRNRLRSSALADSGKAYQFRGQVEGLLQSWRWRGLNTLSGMIGRNAVKSVHGFSDQSLREDGESLYDHLCREMHTASLPELMQPLPLYAQHNPDMRWEMTSRRILLAAPDASEPAGIRALEEATILLTGYGHEVNWIATTDMADERIRFHWPVFCYRTPQLYSSAPDEPADAILLKAIQEHDVLVIVEASHIHQHRTMSPHLQSIARNAGRNCLLYPTVLHPVSDDSADTPSSTEHMKQRRVEAREMETFLKTIAEMNSNT